MDAQLPAPTRTPRLNPFAFPSETDSRFLLLILAVIGAALSIYQIVFNSLPGAGERLTTVVSGCRQLAQEMLAAHPEDPTAAGAALFQCYAPYARDLGTWMVGGTLVLLALATFLYALYPWWKLRRAQLVPLRAEDVPEVVTYLTQLCGAAGLRQPPRFVWNPLNPAAGAVAFGRWGRYYVAVSGGLVSRFYTDQPAFRAVVLHELAHLRNADVDKTYFAVAVWQAFLVAGLLPLLWALMAGSTRTDLQRDAPLVLGLAGRGLVLAAIIYLSRTAVLRTREVYADVRASLWDGAQGALRRVLTAVPEPPTRWWQAIWRVHPSPRWRRQVLDNTQPLFQFAFGEAVVAGLTAALAFPSLDFLLTSFLVGNQNSNVSFTLAAFLVALPAVGVVGLGLWRATFAARALGRRPPPAGRLGIGFGVGFLAGELLGFSSTVTGPYGQPDAAQPLLFIIGWGVFLLVGLFVLFRWLQVTIAAWLDVMGSLRTPRLVYGLGLGLTAVLVAGWIGMLAVVRVGGPDNLALDYLPYLIEYLAEQPVLLLVFSAAWVFALLAWWSRRQPTPVTAAPWTYLDAPPPAPAPPAPAALRPRLIVAAGIAGGLLFLVALLLLRFGMRLALPEVTRASIEFREAFRLGQIGLAALIQALVALALTAGRRRSGIVEGLGAAFLTGSIAALVVLGLSVIGPCLPALLVAPPTRACGEPLDPSFPEFALSTFLFSVNTGAALALALALSWDGLRGTLRLSAADN